MPVAFLGIDWGTHSSKWCYQDLLNHRYVGTVWDSRVWRIGESLAMFPLQTHYAALEGEAALKRKLINDPDQSFWEGPRRKLGVTLGEAVVFSLLALLADAERKLNEKDLSLRDTDELTIRFSHPNWISQHAVPALQNFRDAAFVALTGFIEMTSVVSVEDSFHMQAPQLRSAVERHLSSLPSLTPLPETYSHEAYSRSLAGNAGHIQWQLVFESCAAGLPQLAELESELFDGGAVDPNQHARIRKLLVVDIGAGSTDFGYMLRTILPDPRTDAPTGPALLWLPAAPAFERAGNWLTERIHADWEAQGRKTTPEEAEIYKTSGATDWYEKPYVREWCTSIAERVEHYVRQLPDKRYLYGHRFPPLQIVLTGGSSSVKPIARTVVDRVKTALVARGVAAEVAGNTKSTRCALPSFATQGYSEDRLAQLAVCIGASHPYFAKLKYYPEGFDQ
ncbi:MAG: hypothetical protein HYR59_07690 [Acidobacteria bacterium]|nr:hypothetical protein [Acidobacteriota bacterium]